MGICYLLHFHSPISDKHTTQHYIGYANHLAQRIEHHRQGTSKVRLLEVAHERGISFEVARIWEDVDRDFEKGLKKRKNAPKLCPICCQNTVQTDRSVS